MKASRIRLSMLLCAALAGCALGEPRGRAAGHVLDPHVERFAKALEERAADRSASQKRLDRQTFARALSVVTKHSLEPVEAGALTNAAIAGIGAPVVCTHTRARAIDGAIASMIDSFDDTAAWLEIAEYDERASIGLQLGILEKDVYVVEVSPDGPAEKAGVRPFDRLLAIDGRRTADLEPEQIVALVYGAPGSQSTISVARAGWPEARLLTLVRQPTRIRTVRVEKLAGNIGYARILGFVAATRWDFETELNRIEREGPLAGLIIDLRFNAGGQLAPAQDIANLFLGSGTIVEYVSRDTTQNRKVSADAWRDRAVVPTILLTNAGTAGGADILASALIDNGLARSLGTRTYGLGKAQTTYAVNPTRALRLTTHRVLTGKGVPLGSGLVPTIEMKEADRPMNVECFDDPVVLRAAQEIGRR